MAHDDDADLMMSKTLREIATEKRWSPETFLDRLLAALDEIDAEITVDVSRALIDALEDLD